jgi:hypothetical protein
MLFTHVPPHTKSKGLLIAVPYSAKTYVFYTCSTAYKKQGAPDWCSLIQQKLMLFTRVAPHTKSKRFLIGGPLFSKTYAFYMRSTAYKKQGAPNQWSLIQQKLILFTCVAPRTKSKMGSRSTLRTSSLTFSTRFAVYKKQGAP